MASSIKALTLSLLVLAGINAPTRAADNLLLGTWTIVEATPAPWTEEERHAALTAQGKRLINVTITFKSGEVVSKHKPLACRRVLYEPTTYPADALFQGNLPEPNPSGVALRLGFPKGDIPGVDIRCTSGLFSYHFRDRGTAMTALSNVIYTLKRQ